ncbi:MAG TPA: PepSY-associated TM helix domain-containing protein, partial [Chitinophagaceae bacterium]|nr:PepSY-associated TM helix domain-containing protein [Chitinophagaceae bacterium]
INYIHLWIGIPSAVILFVVCLSGSLYVFSEDISRWIDSDKYAVKPGVALPVEQLKAKVEQQQKGLIVTAVQIPASADEAWVITVKKPSSKEKGQGFIVNQYTGEIKGSSQTSSFKFFNTVMKLHRWMLMDKEIGKWVTGVAAFMFLLLEITGIMLWVPRKIRSWKAWKPGFMVKRKRINLDLHRTVGFYTFIFITIMAMTGPYLGLDWYKQSVNKALGVKPPAKNAAMPIDTTTRVPLQMLLQKADSIYSYSAITRINFPENASGPVTIMKIHKGFSSNSLPDRVLLNAFTGAVIKTERFAEKKLGEKIAASMKSIHTGELFGGFTKIIWFIACLAATSLPVTGVIIWLNKRSTLKRKASPYPRSQRRAFRLPATNN